MKVRQISRIGILQILSRGIGFIRDFLIVYLVGVGGTSDVIFLMIRLPQFLRRIVGEGAINPVMVPFLSQEPTRVVPREYARAFFFSHFSRISRS